MTRHPLVMSVKICFYNKNKRRHYFWHTPFSLRPGATKPLSPPPLLDSVPSATLVCWEWKQLFIPPAVTLICSSLYWYIMPFEWIFFIYPILWWYARVLLSNITRKYICHGGEVHCGWFRTKVRKKAYTQPKGRFLPFFVFFFLTQI